jgi:small conductance mechanosensitive channel
MQETFNKIYGYFIQYGLNVVAALLIFIIGKWLARFASQLVENVILRSKVNKTLATFTKHIVYFGILTFVVIAALNKLGVETNSFIAIIGAAGLAVGFALQGSLSNFAAGVMLIIFQPFQVDDFVEAGGATGTVQEIQIFSTIIETPDKKRIIVPNAKITGDKITIYPSKG